MLLKICLFCLSLSFVSYTVCQRRIVGGQKLNTDKPYMVYIVWNMDVTRADDIERDTKALCGGALITNRLIVTARICLQVKRTLYAVAGYRKYVPNASDKHNDPCIASGLARRKIVEKCYKNDFDRNNLTYYRLKNWAVRATGVALVDQPYDFSNAAFKQFCSYTPTQIPYIMDHLTAGTDVIVLGWGSKKYYRPEGYSFDINSEDLMWVATKIVDPSYCFTSHRLDILYRVCTDGKGSIGVTGQNITRRHGHPDSIINQTEPQFYVMDVNALPPNQTIAYFGSPWNNTRREYFGPCQNDNGSPLVTWINGVETLAGIVIGALVNSQMECVGPFIYYAINVDKDMLSCVMAAKPGETMNCGDKKPCDVV
ncbi:uncharacterized protein LOC142983731 [Anticarsia gemmatalis]|uniref:uncharacterized protein LOC142983731 n=1 Tax=Anticarsia gemmatalis TaxID=129554 RepID=UPI003F770E77